MLVVVAPLLHLIGALKKLSDHGHIIMMKIQCHLVTLKALSVIGTACYCSLYMLNNALSTSTISKGGGTSGRNSISLHCKTVFMLLNIKIAVLSLSAISTLA